MLSDQVLAHHRDAGVCNAGLLLRRGVNDPILTPVNRLSQKTGAHVANDRLTSGNFLERELFELETIRSLIVHVMEEVRILEHNPGLYVHRAAANLLVILHNVHLARLGGLLSNGIGPGPSDEEVSCLALSHQVVANRTELHLGAPLGEVDLEVFWYVQHASDGLLGLVLDLMEFFAPVAHLHDTYTCALVVYGLAACLAQNFLGHLSWAATKVEELPPLILYLLVREDALIFLFLCFLFLHFLYLFFHQIGLLFGE